MKKNITKRVVFSLLVALTGTQCWGAAAEEEVTQTRLAPINFAGLPSGAALLVAVQQNNLPLVQQLITQFQTVIQAIRATRYSPQLGGGKIPPEVVEEEIARLVVQHGLTPDQDMRSWRLTSREGAVTGAVSILKSKFLDYHNGTPLRKAAERGYLEIVRELLNAGAQIDIADNVTHATALIMAIERDNIEIVRKLLSAGANPDLVNRSNNTALILAISKNNYGVNNIKVIQALLSAGANPDLVNKNGFTALMFAVSGAKSNQNAKAIIQALLNAGADPNLANQDGYTALRAATARDLTDVADMLVQYGAWR